VEGVGDQFINVRKSLPHELAFGIERGLRPPNTHDHLSPTQFYQFALQIANHRFKHLIKTSSSFHLTINMLVNISPKS